MKRRRSSRLAAWLAALAMALQAFWPLVAQAKPANALVPVCTVEGVTHYLEVPLPAQGKSAGHDHCAFCVFGAALPGRAPAAVEAVEASGAALAFQSSPSEKPFFFSSEARAPPVLPMVDHRHSGRTDEKNSISNISRSESRGRLLRLGLLHG